MTGHISREAGLIELCRGCSLHGVAPDFFCGDACPKYERIAAIPAADVRPVVLCRDCKHKGWIQEAEHGKSVDYCRLIERCVDKQFFCADGVKREES